MKISIFCIFPLIPDTTMHSFRHVSSRLFALGSRTNSVTGNGSKFPACFRNSRGFPGLNPASRKLSSIPACLWPSNLPRATEWGYGTPGPNTWPSDYPDAGGSSQSPIDIVSSAVQPRNYEPPLRWQYDPGAAPSVVNTGCGWRVDINGQGSVLSGGPLIDSYEPVQFHCHWGDSSEVGSEHTVDGSSYAGELHFVHWNKDKYATCAEALKSPHGLTVIGVLLEEGDANSELQKLCDVLPKIPDIDQRVELTNNLDIVAMFPADQSYWTYPGSLTTPPCYESVTWILFKNPITISHEQLKCFRSMKKPCRHKPGGEQCLVDFNFRPPQLLNGREVCECD